MLTLRRISLYSLVAVCSVLSHALLRLALKPVLTRWALGLASIYAFKLIEARKLTGSRKKAKQDSFSYFVPLGVTLLLLGEAAEAINAAVNPDPFDQPAVHRSAVHASLAFSVIAECEWWRDFSSETYHEKFAVPELETIHTNFPIRPWMNRVCGWLLNLLSLTTWFTIFLALGWLAAVVLYHDARGAPGLFFDHMKGVTPGWFYFYVLLCNPLMLAAKMIHYEVEKRLLPGENRNGEDSKDYGGELGLLRRNDSSHSLNQA